MFITCIIKALPTNLDVDEVRVIPRYLFFDLFEIISWLQKLFNDLGVKESKFDAPKML